MKLSKPIQPADYSHSFNKFVFNQVPSDKVVLDVGCWNGNLGGRLIQSKKCVVDGVDFKKDVLKESLKKGYRKTYLINLNSEKYNVEVIKDRYDVIIFADILEHLIDPGRALIEFRKLLKKNGIIVISMPNVAFILNRIQLLLGNWDYREFGTLDKTHLRFFTQKSLTQLVRSTGYEILEIKPYNQFGLLQYISPLDKLMPTLFTYQLMVIAKKLS